MPKNLAVLSYPNSNNLGDFIQSIAAQKWAGEATPSALNRDQLKDYEGPAVNLIMNGWFMEPPYQWPPSEMITPFFISFHLNPTAKKGMLNPQGVSYFKKHQPIGCRDLHTAQLLSSYGIKTFYSGCLTLTLNRDDFLKKDPTRTGIYVISPMERLNPENDPTPKGRLQKALQQLKKGRKQKRYERATKRLELFLEKQQSPVYFRSQLRDPKTLSEQGRIAAAEKQLKDIANAALVITSRIHTALPAVAFGTPVLFLSDGLEHPNQKSRFEGMETLFPILTSEELHLWEGKFPEPSKNHLLLVERMEKERAAFFNGLK
jgi:hypothetical protein